MFCSRSICSEWQGEGICFLLCDGRMLDNKRNYKYLCWKEQKLSMMKINRMFSYHLGEF